MIHLKDIGIPYQIVLNVCFEYVLKLRTYIFCHSCLVGNKIFGSSHCKEIFVTKFITRKVIKGFNICISRRETPIQGQLSTPFRACFTSTQNSIACPRDFRTTSLECIECQKYLTCYVIMTSSVNEKRSIFTHL